jgi:DNA-binding beta-propeller fold protein YncE
LGAKTFATISQAGGAALQWPINVDFHAGKLAVADARRAAVFILDAADGRTLATLGSGLLQRPAAVAWTDGGRQLWVLDAGAHQLVVFDAGGATEVQP